MLNVKKDFKDYVEIIQDKLTRIELSSEVVDSLHLEDLKAAIEGTELLIPVVGAFNSGKSTLINSFLGQEYLPVNIIPETALATEIRYSEDERIEAVKKDGSINRFTLDKIGSIGTEASMYKLMRVYIANQKILNIQPLILVDMPGFQSPLELHNQAIREYINKGVHYIVLTSVKDGTITRRMRKQLQDIQEYRRDFDFLGTKIDLCTPKEVEEVTAELQKSIKTSLGLEKAVFPANCKSGKILQDVLSRIDPELLFNNLFNADLKDSYYSVKESINTLNVSLGRSKEENEEAIRELKQSIERVKEERDKLLQEAKEKYSDIESNRIIEKVGKAVSDDVESLVGVTMSQGKEALSSTVSEIVRHALIANVSNAISEIGNEIIGSISTNLSDFGDINAEFALADEYIERISSSSRTMLNTAQSGMERFLSTQSGSGKMFKTVSTALAITTSVISPILEIVIVFLPEVIKFIKGIFGGDPKEKQRKQIRTAILTQMIPEIKGKLRKRLPVIFNQQVDTLINTISNRFEEDIARQRDVIDSAQKEKEEAISDIKAIISQNEETLGEITTIANELVFSRKG